MSEETRLKTKNKIKIAFTQLIIEKGFERLTVTDIARSSKLNRGTFYLYYTDKYDLLQQLEDSILQKVAQILTAPLPESEPKTPELIHSVAILEALTFMQTELPFIQGIISDNGDPYFTNKLKRLIGHAIQQKVTQNRDSLPKFEGIPVEYVKEILLSSIMGIIILWLEKGCEEPPEEIALLFPNIKYALPFSVR